MKNNLNNKKIIFLLALLITIIPLCNAEGYGSGLYGRGIYGNSTSLGEFCGDGICNNGETCSSCVGDCGVCSIAPSGGGGSGGSSSCTYDWQCTAWSPEECPASKTQERICINRGTCKGLQAIPQQKQTCVYLHKEPLFDIFLTLPDKYREICSGEDIKATVRLENYGKIELLDAFMTYWIIDENNSLITELKDTRAVTSEKEFEIKLKLPESSMGTYRIYAQINYDKNKTAIAGETFQVLSSENCELPLIKNFNWNYLILGLIALFLLLVLLIVLSRIILFIKGRNKNLINHELEKGFRYLAEGNISEAMESYKTIKRIYDSMPEDNSAMQGKIIEFYNALLKNKF